MKAENLLQLATAGFNVPPFSITESEDSIVLPGESEDMYAVRSSYEGEDGHELSYAGQFKTYLNVAAEDVKPRIKDVLNSMAELSDNGPDNSNCVIIQKMVNSEKSGIVFTSNPLGILNEMVIVIGNGYGDGIVSDTAESTTWYYHKDDKKFFGGDENTELSLLEDIVDTAQKVEDELGYSVDMEFAYADEQLYVLQARPITAMDYSHPVILDNSNIVENYPGITLPLTQEFMEDVYSQIMRNLVKRLSADDDEIMGAVNDCFNEIAVAADNRLYYRIDNWYKLLSCLPASRKIINVWQDSLGIKNRDLAGISLPEISLSKKAATGPRAMKMIMNCQKEMVTFNGWFERFYRKYSIEIALLKNIQDALNLYDQMFDEAISMWDITLVNDLYLFITSAFEKDKTKIANIAQIESMKPVYWFNKIVEIAIDLGMDSEKYEEEKGFYIRKYGDRVPEELKLETHTYRTHPELFDEAVARLVEKGEVPFIPEKENETVDDKLVKKIKIATANREKSRLNRTRLFGLVREIIRFIGSQLEKERKLDFLDDVFYLRTNEFFLDAADIKSLVEKRKLECGESAELPNLSRMVYSDGVIIHPKVRASSEIVVGSNVVLSGTGTSAGIEIGQVVVVDSAPDARDVEGKIVVTKSTDPGWVLALSKAKAIIAERGSLLSHTAIVSRELGIPSVVGIENAAQLFTDGETVVVNGTEGIVKRKTTSAVS